MLTKEQVIRIIQQSLSFRPTLYAAVVCLLAACSTDDEDIISGTARVSVTHAATGAPALDAYIQGVKINSSPLIFGSTTGLVGNPYLTVNAGTQFMSISADGTTNLVQGNIPFTPDSSYSIFTYDTINTSGTLRVLLLNDRLTPPATGKSNIRFLQLSPDTGRIYVRLGNPTDTILVGYRPYLTATTSTEIAATAVFSAVNAGNYTLTVQLTDSTPVVYSTPVSLTAGRIITLYSKGRKSNGAGPLGFSISTLLHN